MDWEDSLRPENFDVKVAEMMVATADGADPAIEDAVPQVLRLLREKMNMDVVFVSEFSDGRRVFRDVDEKPGTHTLSPGMSDPLEESWCQRVVDGRLPEYIPNAQPLVDAGDAPHSEIPIGTHMSTPIVLADGAVYGTLCCFSFAENDRVGEQDLKKLKYTAQLTAQKIDKARREDAAKLASALELQPMQPRGTGGFKGRL
jgi:GAF domain-containing protein